MTTLRALPTLKAPDTYIFSTITKQINHQSCEKAGKKKITTDTYQPRLPLSPASSDKNYEDIDALRVGS